MTGSARFRPLGSHHARASSSRITAGTIRIGDSLAGNVTISSLISESNVSTVFDIASGGTITETGGGRLTVSGVALLGTAGVDLSLNASTVNNIAGRTTAAGANFKFTNTSDLFVSTVDGVSGIILTDGNVVLKVNAAGGLDLFPERRPGFQIVHQEFGGGKCVLAM